MEPSGPFALTNSLAGFLAPLIVGLIGILLLYFANSSNVLLQSESQRSSILERLCVGFGIFWPMSSCSCYVADQEPNSMARNSSIRRLTPRSVTRTPSLAVVFDRSVPMAIVVGCIVFVGSLGTFLWRDPEIISEASKSLSYRMDYWKGLSN